jgi:LAS superfamily LD-carboxypeptidase LdcB
MQKILRKNVLIGVVGAALLVAAAAIFLEHFAHNSLLLAQSKTTVAVSENIAVQNLPENTTAIVTAKTFLSASELNANVAKNQLFKFNLNWNFGGKQQRGWYIYEPLICDLIGVENEIGQNDFTDALAQWQQVSGMPANGVLDEATLMSIIATWQGRRFKNKVDQSPGQLIVAPPSDFFTPSRPAEFRQVESNTYEAYKKMVQAAAADKSLNLNTTKNGELAESEQFLKIISSHRSREYQAKLRQASPNSGRAGLAINSPHFTGRALDIYVGGDPVSTIDANRALQVKTPIYKWLVKNAGKYGFKPYFYEPWHWEYAPIENTQ